ncbi:hypothetical protein [Scytonema sp. NUACC26]|uniref:hypothetical protein n=1 Tax=Scytonema sp. NUACC26 TaxID=3140176 RepID=UPI0034DBC1DC
MDADKFVPQETGKRYRYWEEQLYRTQGEVLKPLPLHQAGKERIANIALKVVKQRPDWSDHQEN